MSKEYVHTDFWEMCRAIKSREEQVICCDTPPYIGYSLSPSGDHFKIDVTDLKKSFDRASGWKANLVKLSFSSAQGKQNLAKSLSKFDNEWTSKRVYI